MKIIQSLKSQNENMTEKNLIKANRKRKTNKELKSPSKKNKFINKMECRL